MAEIMKGIVTSFVGDQVAVKPCNSEDTVSPPLDNQWRPCGNNVTCSCTCTEGHYDGCPLPALKVGDIVAFAVFEDGTGIVLGKMVR